MIRASGKPGGDLGDAVGPGRVIGAGHGDLAAEAAHGVGDPRVVGGDDDPVERVAASRRLDDVLDQRPARVGEEGFAGQAG